MATDTVYEAVRNVNFNGHAYAPGATIPLDAKSARQLTRIGAVREIAAAVREIAAAPESQAEAEQPAAERSNPEDAEKIRTTQKKTK